MPGIQEFLSWRQDLRRDPRRQIVGNQQRVPVPVTKLQRPEPTASSEWPNQISTAEPSVNVSDTPDSGCIAGLQFDGQGDGFDTDAEGLDDTTIINNYDVIQDHNNLQDRGRLPENNLDFDRNGLGQGVQGLIGDGKKSGQVLERLDNLEVEDLVVEGDNDSYEESEDEEVEEEAPMSFGLYQELNSPGYTQYRQQETSFSKQAVIQSLMASPSMRRDLAEGAERQEIPSKPFVPLGYHASGHDEDFEVRPPQAVPQHTSAPMRRPVQTTAMETQNKPMEQRMRPESSKNQQGLMEQPATSIQTSQQHRTTPDHAETIDKHSMCLSLVPSQRLQADTMNSQDSKSLSIPPPPRRGGLTGSSSMSKGLRTGESAAKEDMDVDEAINSISTMSPQGLQNRKRALDLDYTLDQLADMQFSQLGNESFDIASEEGGSTNKLPNSTLAEQVHKLMRPRERDNKAQERRSFFASLPIEQYEGCGDLILDGFYEIVTRYRGARLQRRKAAKEIEEEVANREECVRAKKNIVEQDLSRLKRGGEDVVRCKTA